MLGYFTEDVGIAFRFIDLKNVLIFDIESFLEKTPEDH